jgi:hypothetical protein
MAQFKTLPAQAGQSSDPWDQFPDAPAGVVVSNDPWAQFPDAPADPYDEFSTKVGSTANAPSKASADPYGEFSTPVKQRPPDTHPAHSSTCRGRHEPFRLRALRSSLLREVSIAGTIWGKVNQVAPIGEQLSGPDLKSTDDDAPHDGVSRERFRVAPSLDHPFKQIHAQGDERRHQCNHEGR